MQLLGERHLLVQYMSSVCRRVPPPPRSQDHVTDAALPGALHQFQCFDTSIHAGADRDEAVFAYSYFLSAMLGAPEQLPTPSTTGVASTTVLTAAQAQVAVALRLHARALGLWAALWKATTAAAQVSIYPRRAR